MIDPPIAARGIDFLQARSQVIQAIKRAIKKKEDNDRKEKREAIRFGTLKNEGYSLTVLAIPAICCILLVVSLASQSPQRYISGPLVSLAVIISVVVLNVYLHQLVSSSESREIKRELELILHDYEKFSEHCMTSSPNDQIGHDSDPYGESAAIFSGHPHISIVTVYRNSCWMRIPSLGLVEGDIVALMAGDVTPGRVFELLPEESVLKNVLHNVLKNVPDDSDLLRRSDENEDILISNISRKRDNDALYYFDDDVNSCGSKSRPASLDVTDAKSAEKSVHENCETITVKLTEKNEKKSKVRGQDRFWWRNQESAVDLGPTDSIPIVLNPILGARNGINRNGKILEKGTTIHLRTRISSGNGENRTSSLKGSNSGSEMGTTFGENRTGRNNRRSVTHNSYRSQTGGAVGRGQVPLSERHRSLASNSPELLLLSGDVRCFQMADTPIEIFCEKLLLEGKNGDRNSTEVLDDDLEVPDRVPSIPDLAGLPETIESSNSPLLSTPSPLSPTFIPPPTPSSSTIPPPSSTIPPPSSTSFLPPLSSTSWIRSIFLMTIEYAHNTSIIIILFFLILCILRLSLVPNNLTFWTEIVLNPIVSIILCLSPLSFSLPFGLLFVEAATTAGFLATSEVILRGDRDEKPNIAKNGKKKILKKFDAESDKIIKVPEAVSGDLVSDSCSDFGAIGNPLRDGEEILDGRGARKYSSDIKIADIAPNNLNKIPSDNKHEKNKNEDENKGDDGNECTVENRTRRGSDEVMSTYSSTAGGKYTNNALFETDGNDVGDEESDEFLDEDIDDRAEDKALENDKKVQWGRLFEYFFHVLRSRLGWPQQRPWVEHSRPHTQSQSTETKPSFTSALLSSSPFSFLSLTPTLAPIPCPIPSVSRPLISYPTPLLPVPLARSRLLESLGAVTMCCFVDDDIICEGYSVTEEIFLLKGDGETSKENVSNTSAAQKQSHKEHSGSAPAEGSSVAVTPPAAKSVVLDLHANPEASGSRFENPLWWKFLSSLKPIGLNALLTFSPFAPLMPSVIHSQGESIEGTSGNNSAAKSDIVNKKYMTNYGNDKKNNTDIDPSKSDNINSDDNSYLRTKFNTDIVGDDSDYKNSNHSPHMSDSYADSPTKIDSSINARIFAGTGILPVKFGQPDQTGGSVTIPHTLHTHGNSNNTDLDKNLNISLPHPRIAGPLNDTRHGNSEISNLNYDSTSTLLSQTDPSRNFKNILNTSNLQKFERKSLSKSFGTKSSASTLSELNPKGQRMRNKTKSRESRTGLHRAVCFTSDNDRYMESSLVAHVRKSLPLESLRELAEEIGFQPEDTSYFTRLLEMNVLAPRLGDSRLLEDTHAWGQEETKRRGTLACQIRGTVVLDSRGGGLQMMCHGDPVLLLSYCKEHWDGLSIAPLSASDRKEVTNISHRWFLEDFDVVAFSYTPVQNHLQPMIMQAYNDSILQASQETIAHHHHHTHHHTHSTHTSHSQLVHPPTHTGHTQQQQHVAVSPSPSTTQLNPLHATQRNRTQSLSLNITERTRTYSSAPMRHSLADREPSIPRATSSIFRANSSLSDSNQDTRLNVSEGRSREKEREREREKDKDGQMGRERDRQRERERERERDSFGDSRSGLDSTTSNHSSARAVHRHVRRTHGQQSQANCLFFVDPCTSLELMSPSSHEHTQGSSPMGMTSLGALSVVSIATNEGKSDKDLEISSGMISIGGNRPDLMTKSKSFDDIKKINENNSNKERRRSSGSEKKSEKNENIVQSSSTDTVYVDSKNVPLDPIDILLRERLSQEDLGPSDSTKTSNSLSENKNPLGILGSLGTLPTFKSLRGLNIFPKHSNSDSDLSGKLTTNTKKLKSPKESRNFGDFFIRRITTNEKENEGEGEQEEGEGEGEGMEDDEAGGEVLELLDEDGFSDNFDDQSVEKNSDRHLSMGGNEGEGEGEAGYDSDLISLNLIYSKTPTEDSVNNTGNNSEIFENNNSDISDDSTSTSKNQKKKELKSDEEDHQNKNEKKNENDIGGCDPIPPKSGNILDRITGNSPKSSEVKKIFNHFEKDDNGDIVRDVEKVTNSIENENAGIDNGRESVRRNTSKKETEEGHERGNDDDDDNDDDNERENNSENERENNSENERENNSENERENNSENERENNSENERENNSENERENNSENERENQYVDIENDTSSYTADRKSDFPTKSITDNNDYSGNENDSTVGETEANSVTYNTAHTAPIQSDSITTDARTLYSTDNNAKSTRITRAYPPTSSTHTSTDPSKRSIASSLWPMMRTQIFLGMAASSVPIRREVPDLREELTQAGVRFVYFSSRNMRRSKPVAEKIGLQFDWNCAISLRALENGIGRDPHRYISQYADWDVHAKMPHGIEAIRTHLKEVDNVPLLVSLFTDSTSSRIREMVRIFKENGEVVLCVGSSCRLQNHSIFQVSDLAVAVATLPGDKQQIPVDIGDLINRFPTFYGSSSSEKIRYSNGVDNNDNNNDNNNNNDINNVKNNNTHTHTHKHTPHASCLSRDDLLLHYRLVGLGTAPLLQLPPVLASSVYAQNLSPRSNGIHGGQNLGSGKNQKNVISGVDNGMNNSTGNHTMNDNDNNNDNEGGNSKQLKLSALLEGIHMGRIYLVNSLQVGAFISVCCLSMSFWPLIACALPLSLPPSLPPPIALLFLFIYIPLFSFAILFGPGPDGVMKATPRKNIKIKSTNKKNIFSDIFNRNNELDMIKDSEVYSESEMAVHQQQRDRKNKDEARFFRYLLTRCLYVGFSLFITGWLASVAIFSTQDPPSSGRQRKDYRTMISFTIITDSDRNGFWLLQDVISVSLLFSLIGQAATLVERGASIRFLPTIAVHGYFYSAAAFSIILHTCILLIRAILRETVDNGYTTRNSSIGGVRAYGLLGWYVWVASVVVLPAVGVVISVAVNKYDGTAHRRYLQYLRLEFDTRLGMHSPR